MFYVEKTKKLVFWTNLLNQKGCDASNMYDEEADDNSDDELSDEEQEKARMKIVNKVKNQRKRKNRDFDKKPHHGSSQGSVPYNAHKKRDLKHENMVSQYSAQPPYPYMQAPQYAPNIPSQPYPAPYAYMPPQSHAQYSPFQYAPQSKFRV